MRQEITEILKKHSQYLRELALPDFKTTVKIVTYDTGEKFKDPNGNPMPNKPIMGKKHVEEKIPVIKTGVPANLSNRDLRFGDFHDINFQDANLSGADLTAANVRNCNMSGAKVDGMKIFKSDASKCKNLDISVAQIIDDPPLRDF